MDIRSIQHLWKPPQRSEASLRLARGSTAAKPEIIKNVIFGPKMFVRVCWSLMYGGPSGVSQPIRNSLNTWWGMSMDTSHSSASYAHTMVKPPDPIRTPKLSTIGPAQYCGGGPRGNRRWCTFLPYQAEEFSSFLSVTVSYSMLWVFESFRCYLLL